MISFAQQFLGMPDVVHAVGGRFPNGVESEVGMLFGWSDGRFASEAIGFTVPGPGRQIVAGTDSHTCMAGALGCFAFGVGSTAMAFALRTGLVPGVLSLGLGAVLVSQLSLHRARPGSFELSARVFLLLTAVLGTEAALVYALFAG